MTFLSTWAFSFLGLIPVIVLLYLLKLKRRPVKVSTLLFWQKALQQNRRRALFQRLRQFLSLLLHLLIFLLILLALAQPEWNRLVQSGASVVLLVDTRARMQALGPDGAPRFEDAKELLRQYVRHANADHRMALLVGGSETRVVVPFTSDDRALRKGVDSLETSDAGGDFNSALALAQQIASAGGGVHRIIAVTGDWNVEAPGENVEFVRLPSAGGNVAITRFATRPLPASPETSQVLLELRNFGDATASGNVEFSFDDRLIDVKPFELKPGETKFEVFPSAPSNLPTSRGWLTARLDIEDAMAIDNVAYATLPPNRPLRVLLVSEGNWFIEKMLAANSLIEFEILEPDSFQLQMAATFDAVILDRLMPEGYDLATGPGNLLFLARTPFDVPGSALLSAPPVTESDDSSALMRMIDLRNVAFLRSTRLKLPDPQYGWEFSEPLMAFADPLIVTGNREIKGAVQRIAAFAFDVTQSDLPLRVGFPLLMANTLQWLGGRISEAPQSLRAGQTITLDPGESIWTVPQHDFTYDLPEPNREEIATGTFTPTRNGFYLVKSAGHMDRWMAVNTFRNEESNLPVARKMKGTPRAGFPILKASVSAWPLWFYAAISALLLFTLEWWLFHRRRTE
jgi:hypothetical protein